MLSYQAVVQKGYEKYRDGIFKIPLMDRWLVVLSSPQLISELSKAREQDLSADQATLEVCNALAVIGNDLADS